MKKRLFLNLFLVSILFMFIFELPVFSNGLSSEGLPEFNELKITLKSVVNEKNGGFGLNMWAVVVDRDGIVKAVAFSGNNRGDQWPGSRVIAAQKANTANAFSLPNFSLSTANLFSAVQPGGSLYGLQHSNPVDVKIAYRGSSKKKGTKKDPMAGYIIGGVNVFGGGLALYNSKGKIIGALGVSGDSSCADHNIAWKVRHKLKLDFVPAGISPDKNDNIVYDITDGKSSGGWGHPACSPDTVTIAENFSKTHPVRVKE